MDRECLAGFGCKLEYTGQRDDVLRNRVIVPVKRRMCRRLLEKDGLRFDQFTSRYAATDHMGVAIRTGIEPISPNHDSLRSFSDVGVFKNRRRFRPHFLTKGAILRK